MMKTYYPVHCRAVSQGDKDKKRQMLCVWCIWFCLHLWAGIFSIASLPPFLPFLCLLSHLWCYILQVSPRGPCSATLKSICCWFTRFFGTRSSWRSQNKSDLKERGREQRAAAAAVAESGFYHHKSLLWWGILSNGHFFLTVGVIAFPLWTPLDIYTSLVPVYFCKAHKTGDRTCRWHGCMQLCRVVKHLPSQNLLDGWIWMW